MTIESRLLAKIHKTDGCWEWTGCKDEGGYGRVWWNGRNHPAHRVAYLIWIGPVPPELEVHHHCRNRGCVRPTHLEPRTPKANMSDAANALKTHCPRGHAYDAANTHVLPDGRRECRTCRAKRCRDYKRRARRRLVVTG